MEGITIINTIPIYATANAWMMTVAIVCVLTALVIVVLAYVFKILACDTTSTVLAFITIALIVACLVFVTMYSMSDNTNTDIIQKYQYEVLIEDSVSFNEFNDKYNIIDKRGKIYVIEEKK